MGGSGDTEVPRRGMLVGGAATAALGTVWAGEAQTVPAQAEPVATKVTMEVNGKRRSLTADTRTTLLDALREQLHLTGTKKGCDHGRCGARTVIVDGTRIDSCLSLAVAQKLGRTRDVRFADGRVRSGDRDANLADAARGSLTAEDRIEYGNFGNQYQQSTFADLFGDATVDAYTGVARIRRMLAVCAAGRNLNPKSARSQVIGGMAMGAGAAPIKAKGVGELGIRGVAAAVANAIYNATRVRVRERDYLVTPDKRLARLPRVA